VNGWKDDDGCPDGLATYALAVFDPEGQPLAGATILRPDGTEVGSTDSFGRIVVRDLMPGTTLAVRAEHGAGLYVPGEHESPELVEGEQSGTLRLLWRPGTIRVITRNEDGAPVDSSLKFEGPETRADQLLGSDGTETFVLPPGTWTIFATAPQFGTERREVVLSANENALTVIEFGLRRAVTAVTESGVAILEPVLFEFNSDVLKPESQRLIEQVANTIRITPEIRHLEVQGHTSTEGSDAHNRGLSQRRVDAVVRYLVSHGVERSRLTAIGYGESCTAVREATEADREKNRRVQFYILEPEPPNGIPCHAGVPGQLDSQRFEYQRQRRQ
jgi:outer membrane protein OmpA-like peptidoglycan-associated protein